MWISRSWPGFIPLMLWLGNVSGDEDICQVKCRNKEVTVCDYPDVPSKDCDHFDEQASPFTAAEITDLLEAHNEYRNKVALGQETRGQNGMGQPPAADMIQLVWDDELAANARRWVIQCFFTQNACSRTSKGEFIAQLGTHKSIDFVPIKQVVSDWVTVVKDSNSTIIASSLPGDVSYVIAPFTQIVWSRTKKLGCGRSIETPSDDKHVEYVICNYFPAGNIPGASVYNVGKACSAGPYAHECSTQYPGLCVYNPALTTTRKPHIKTKIEHIVHEIPDELIEYFQPGKHDQAVYVDPTKYSGKRCRSGSTFNTNLCAGVATLYVVALLALDFYVKYGFN